MIELLENFYDDTKPSFWSHLLVAAGLFYVLFFSLYIFILIPDSIPHFSIN